MLGLLSDLLPIFESKRPQSLVNEDKHGLTEFVRIQTKALAAKYEDLKRNNEEF